MFEEAARQWAGLQPAEGHLRIAINLSPRDLLDTEFPQRLEALMHRHGVAASAFCLEITESAIMDDPQRAEATLNKLAEQGFKLSIDDFGTGYSSLAYLKRLPVHELKIDKSFVMPWQATRATPRLCVRPSTSRTISTCRWWLKGGNPGHPRSAGVPRMR